MCTCEHSSNRQDGEGRRMQEVHPGEFRFSLPQPPEGEMKAMRYVVHSSGALGVNGAKSLQPRFCAR